MSLTVEKVISDAKRMANRLKERNLMADQMIIEATIVAEEIEALRQVQISFLIRTRDTIANFAASGRLRAHESAGTEQYQH